MLPGRAPPLLPLLLTKSTSSWQLAPTRGPSQCCFDLKTEVIVLDPKHIRDSLSSNIISLDSITLASSTTVRNLGFFDQERSINSHVTQISCTAFFHLTLLKSGTSCLNKMQKNEFTHLSLEGWIIVILDFQVTLLKILKSLQLIQNEAARVLTRTNIRAHISPILASLHWLPVKFRTEFKILVLTYKANHGF